jgi:hypothetical protein
MIRWFYLPALFLLALTVTLTLTSRICLHSSAAYRDSILRIIPLPALSKRYGETRIARQEGANLLGLNLATMLCKKR